MNVEDADGQARGAPEPNVGPPPPTAADFAPPPPQGFVPAAAPSGQFGPPPAPEDSGAPQNVASTPARKTVSAKKGALVAGGVAAAVLTLLATLWLAGAPKEGELSSDASHWGVPAPSATVAVADAEVPIELVPLGESGTASGDGLTVFGAEIGEDSKLVAMDSVAVGRPVWEVPVEGLLSQCVVKTSTIDCGSAGTFSLLTGENASSGESTDASAAEAATAQPEDESTEGAEDSAAGAGEGGSGGRGPAALTPAAQKLSTTVDHDVPYRAHGKEVVDADGTVVATFSSDSVWQVNNEELGGETWVFTDGQEIVAVSSGKTLWEKTLPPGSAALNTSSDHCSITMDEGTLVVGEPGSLVGLSLEDGEETWRVEVPLKSWFASDDTLMVAGDGDVHLLHFAEPGAGTEGEGTSSVQQLQATNLPKAPTYEELANGSLQLPKGLAEGLHLPGQDQVEMVSGVYQQTSEFYGAFVFLHEVTPLYVGGDAYAVALTTYGLYGSDAVGSGWMIYDAEKRLVDDHSIEYLPGLADLGTVRAFSDGDPNTKAWFLPSPEGSFTVEYETYADYSHQVPVRVTWDFDGTRATLTNFELGLPSGTSAAPNQQRLQEIYDLIADGRDDEAAPYVDGDLLRRIQTLRFGDIGGEESLRTLSFGKGGKIGQCVLASPGWGYDGPVEDADGIVFQGSAEEEPGTWYCGLQTELVPTHTNPNTGTLTYSHHLVVSTDEDGNPYVKDLARFYS